MQLTSLKITLNTLAIERGVGEEEKKDVFTQIFIAIHGIFHFSPHTFYGKQHYTFQHEKEKETVALLSVERKFS